MEFHFPNFFFFLASPSLAIVDLSDNVLAALSSEKDDAKTSSINASFIVGNRSFKIVFSSVKLLVSLSWLMVLVEPLRCHHLSAHALFGILVDELLTDQILG